MTQFKPDRRAYIRNHLWLAGLGMVGATALLWLLGSPHYWTGAPAGLLAIAVRGWYLASEELAVIWKVDDTALTGPAERRIGLTEIQTLRSMGSFVQVITSAGDKHLIKYQADPVETIARIRAAINARQP